MFRRVASGYRGERCGLLPLPAQVNMDLELALFISAFISAISFQPFNIFNFVGAQHTEPYKVIRRCMEKVAPNRFTPPTKTAQEIVDVLVLAIGQITIYVFFGVGPTTQYLYD